MEEWGGGKRRLQSEGRERLTDESEAGRAEGVAQGAALTLCVCLGRRAQNQREDHGVAPSLTDQRAAGGSNRGGYPELQRLDCRRLTGPGNTI